MRVANTHWFITADMITHSNQQTNAEHHQGIPTFHDPSAAFREDIHKIKGEYSTALVFSCVHMQLAVLGSRL